VLLKVARCIGVSLTGMALANVAWAQETTVMTLAKSAKLGGEFRSELLYDNNKLTETEAHKAKSSTDIEVQNVNIKLNGMYNNDTEYSFRFNLWDPLQKGGPLDYGYGTYWFNPMVGYSMGKMRVLQGGWDNIDSSYRDHVIGVYAQNLVFGEYENMFALHIKAAGLISFQVLNDVVRDGANGDRWNTTVHPTWVLGWMGEFGPVKPLIDFGSYDNNKSRWIDVGIKTDMAGLDATLDYYNQNNVHRVFKTDGKATGEADVATSITLKVAYEVKNVVTPWIYFSTYENKQADDKNLATPLADHKFNSQTKDATGNVTYNFDDNGMVYGVGVNIDGLGKGWTPYVALTSTAGKFESETKAGETKTKSDMQVKIGVLGEI
jgi:hypothetical protein